MDSKNLSNYIELLRYGRKISQENLVHEITSLRQYQRYRSGDCDIPLAIVGKFAKKLGVSSSKLLLGYESEIKNQQIIINNYYNAVVNRKLDDICNLRKEITNHEIIEDEKVALFQCAEYLNLYFEKRLASYELFEKLSNLIDYPNLLRKSILSEIEVFVLSNLLGTANDTENEKIILKLKTIYEDETVLVTGTYELASTQVLFRIAKYYGKLMDYPNVLKFCNLGIDRGLFYKQYYLFEFFFYYSALAYFRTNDFPNFEKYLFRCFSVLEMEGNQNRKEKFRNMILKDLEINLDEFAKSYITKSR